MSTENIDTMGFEPAVEYDVPDFGKVHVLMRGGEPWFLSAELSGNTEVGHRKAGGYLSAWIGEHSEIRDLCMIVSPSSLRAVGVNGRKVGRRALLVPLQAVKACIADNYIAKNFPELDKVVRWWGQLFERTTGKLPYVVKYDKLEVVFYNYGLYATVVSLLTTVGVSAAGGATRAKWRKEKKVIKIHKEEAAELGLSIKGCRANSRDLMTFAGVESYLKDECRQEDKYLVLHWFLKEVVPAAKKHLEALKAQENAEAEAKARVAEEAKKTEAAKVEPKPVKEETPLLLNAEIVPPAAASSAPSSLSYDELLSSWRVTMKAQEATLKELETAKKDLASRIARIDEQNADIKTLVGNNNAFQAERRKLNEEIESLKASIKDLAALHKDREDRADLVFETVRALLGLKGFDFVSDAEAVDGDSQLAVPLSEEEKHNCLLQGISNMKQYVAMQDAVIKEWTREYNILEKRLADAKAALAAKEAELSQANAKLKEAEEKAACEHNNCDAILAELKAEREAKKELISKYRDTVSENDFLLKALNDRNSLKLVPPYLPPMPLHKAKEL